MIDRDLIAREQVCYYDDLGRLQVEEVECNIEMSEHHRKYICRIIEAVKTAFRELLKDGE